MKPVLVLTNLPDRDHALRLARALVEQRLAACVNVLAACTSVYRWKEAIETAQEIPLLIKTTEDRYPSLEQAVRALHPYEVPELVVVPIGNGLPEYLSWIESETTGTNP
jgi:periplasmic divalent cation tolerance protein